VPADLSIVGLDNIRLASKVAPRLLQWPSLWRNWLESPSAFCCRVSAASGVCALPSGMSSVHS
jgi:hypothetical protein